MGGTRKFRAERCGGCGLHRELCLCESAPRVELETRVVLVQNDHERSKPTNTGRLAHLMLPNSRLLRYGVRGQVFDPTPLCEPNFDYFLIFHREGEARTLSRESSTPSPGRGRTLVFLDGTWAQCSRMSHRVPGVAEIPVLTLPPGRPSPWRVREETHADRVSTLEAIIRALAIVEGPSPARQMREWFYRVTARLMYMKSMLDSPEMPVAWAELLRDD